MADAEFAPALREAITAAAAATAAGGEQQQAQAQGSGGAAATARLQVKHVLWLNCGRGGAQQALPQLEGADGAALPAGCYDDCFVDAVAQQPVQQTEVDEEARPAEVSCTTECFFQVVTPPCFFCLATMLLEVTPPTLLLA